MDKCSRRFYEPLIDDGSKILIKKQTSVDSGQIAAVLVDDEEAVVKKVLYNDNTVELPFSQPLLSPTSVQK